MRGEANAEPRDYGADVAVTAEERLARERLE
jgi:hypothetical protein